MKSRYVGTKMFHLITRTWNPITGCKHECIYCWARRFALTKLKNTRKYRFGFSPRFHEDELKVKFNGGMVFVTDMGDMWGEWVPREWILKVLEVVRRHPKTTFLFLTKNPRRYLEFMDELKELSNVVLGATVETDDDEVYREYRISKAPPPSERMASLSALKMHGFRNIMVSVEPILMFTNEFSIYLTMLKPAFIYVGYDNYRNKLPEPPLRKTIKLIETLKQEGIAVHEKTLRKAWWEDARR